MSTVIKQYNTLTSQWEAILVGEPGPVASNSSVTNAMLSTMPPLTIKGNLSGSTDVVRDNPILDVSLAMPVSLITLSLSTSGTLELNNSNKSIGVGGRLIDYNSALGLSAYALSSSNTGDCWFMNQAGAGVCTFISGSGYLPIVGNPKTAGQNTMVACSVFLDSGINKLRITGGVA